MKILTCLFLVLILPVQTLIAQDTIVTTAGDEILCKILKETEFQVLYNYRYNGEEFQKQISRSEISHIGYQSIRLRMPEYGNRFFVGIGTGLDFGGLGVNLMYNLGNSIGVYAGGGYAFAGFGINGGASLRLTGKNSTSRVVPYFTAMYGYNAAIAVMNQQELNKLFYGPSFGFGIEFRRKGPRIGCWTLALILPLRSEEVDEYIDHLKTYHYVEFANGLSPVLLSLGYRFSN
ncbi:MAG: hypothetical protein JNL22_11860 [Bacteroidales bacterium]|nr:hypothetical protein [Bacteroidales bacterium]